MSFTKLIFGLHNPWESATIAITGQPNAPSGVLTISNGVTIDLVPWDGKGWTKKLPAGDFLLRLELENPSQWVDGAATIQVTDRQNVTFVVHGPETEAPNQHLTTAWTAAATNAGNDPKDPWPPPGPVATTLPPAAAAWHEATLHAAATDPNLVEQIAKALVF